jgi:hypothetical protein
MADRYDALIARTDKDGKKRYTKIGAAFPSRNGDGFSIVLDALPMPNADGQAWIMLYPPKPKEDRQSNGNSYAAVKGRAQAPVSDDMNDQIPF